MSTEDGIDIQGWYTNSSEKLVIIVHGHADHSSIMFDRYDAIFPGYDRFYLDLRNHGRSGTHKPITLGVNESRDVSCVVDWVAKHSWDTIVVFGTSMGAIASLLADSPSINAFILDSMFIDPEEVMRLNMEKHHLPKIWITQILWYITNIRIPEFGFPNILGRMSNISKPLLYLHGSNDVEAPPSILDHIDKLNNSYIRTRIVDEGEHSRLFLHDEYMVHVQEFLGAIG